MCLKTIKNQTVGADKKRKFSLFNSKLISFYKYNYLSRKCIQSAVINFLLKILVNVAQSFYTDRL